MRASDGVEVPVGTLTSRCIAKLIYRRLHRTQCSILRHSVWLDNMDWCWSMTSCYTGRTIPCGDERALFNLGRPKRVSLCVLIDRGHREMPIERSLPARSADQQTEIIEVRLREIDSVRTPWCFGPRG